MGAVTTRRAMLGAIAATGLAASAPAPALEAAPDRGLWDERLARYQVLDALMDATYDFGPMYAANEAWDREVAGLTKEFGTLAQAKADPRGAKRRDAAWARLNKIERQVSDNFNSPAGDAAKALVVTPAPDIAAFHLKLAAIRKHELHLYIGFEDTPFAAVAADAKRLLAA